MTAQSVSVVVPSGLCWNNCKFCVSRMRCEAEADNSAEVFENCVERLRYAKEQGCGCLILTGTAEPQQNLPWIGNLLSENNKSIGFTNIELQTTGSGLEEEQLVWLKKKGLKTVSVSLSAPTSERNWNIIGATQKNQIPVEELCRMVVDAGLMLRMSINLTDEWEKQFEDPELIFSSAKRMRAKQIIFRVLYADGGTNQAEWVRKHSASKAYRDAIKDYVIGCGNPMRRLPYGKMVYSVDGLSVVIDDDCMAKDNVEGIRYYVIKADGRLYTRWDDSGSIVF